MLGLCASLHASTGSPVLVTHLAQPVERVTAMQLQQLAGEHISCACRLGIAVLLKPPAALERPEVLLHEQ